MDFRDKDIYYLKLIPKKFISNTKLIVNKLRLKSIDSVYLINKRASLMYLICFYPMLKNQNPVLNTCIL